MVDLYTSANNSRESIKYYYHQSLLFKRRESPDTNKIPDPIHERGWCLQEAMLSNRILHRRDSLGMQRDQALRVRQSLSYKPRHNVPPHIETSGKFRSQSLQMAYRQWQDIVHLYSQRSLSVDTDKLPALSGLADRFNNMLRVTTGRSEKYIAGMWAGDLVISLLWLVESDVDRDGFTDADYRRPDIWRAPTWSMMAIEGPVVIENIFQWNLEVEVVDVSVELTNPLAPYGSLSPASLVLYGQVVYGLKMITTQGGERSHSAINGIIYLIKDQKGNTHVILCDDPPSLLPEADDLACLYMGHTYAKEESEAFRHAVLVLRKSEMVPDAFERIGISAQAARGIRATNNTNTDMRTQYTNIKQLFEGAPKELVKII